MPTRRFRKRGGTCPENQADCPPPTEGQGFIGQATGAISDGFNATKDAAAGFVNTATSSLTGNPSTETSSLTGNPTEKKEGEQGILSGFTGLFKGGKRRKTKRRRAKRRTRR